MKRTRGGDGEVEVLVAPDGISEGRANDVVDACLDLISVDGGAKVTSEPRREACGIEPAASGAGELESEFSEDDECNTSTKGR
jgi:hypothetical protein